jgi:serine/threonine protein kinase
MALSKHRIHWGGETEYPWEREAIDFVIEGLPDVDPYHVWPLHELLVPSTGKLYELDLIVIGKHALYLVEAKSWPGKVTGDVRDWQIHMPGVPRPQMKENPYHLVNRKAKVLATLVRNELPAGQSIWVEPLVFLSSEKLDVKLPENARSHVVERKEIIRALTRADYRGADPRKTVNRPLMRDLIGALERLGLRPSATRRIVGQYQLGALLAEGNGFQDNIGTHLEVPDRKVRIRSYLVAQATTSERRAQLERAARREMEVLTRLGEHRAILRCHDLVVSADRGPALLFERFEEGIPLDQLLRVRPDLPFGQRIEIIGQVAEAIDFCHRQGVLHRALSPQTILVRESDNKIEVRLHSFQLARRDDATTSGTHHLSDLGDPAAQVYRSPEMQVDPAKASALSDIWSLGAVAYFVLTGQPPAATLRELVNRLEDHGALHPGAVTDDLDQEIDGLIALATCLHTDRRADSAIAWFNLLQEVVTTPSQHGEKVDPLVAKPGDRLDHDLVVRGKLGSGATAQVLRVERGERVFALKVPRDGSVQRLRAEAEVLERLRHPAIVRCHSVLEVGGRVCLLLDYASEQTLAGHLRQEGTVNLDYSRRFGDDLLSALQHLEEQGLQHRDIKPGNIGFTLVEKKAARHLLLFDFSLATLPAHQVSAGTPAYRDPSLLYRGEWDAAADRYSAAATLYEMLTGSRPQTVERDSGGFAAQVEAERFDAAVRDQMTKFFRRAFDPDADQRFESAEQMKTEWLALYAEQREETRVTRPAQAPVSLEDPVDMLDLGTRARNALDRAGVLTVRELLTLPRNHLSAIRGIGVKVAKEIVRVADQLREQFAITTDDGPESFLPELRGRAEPLGEQHGLSRKSLAVLADAALTTTTDLAQAPAARIERLLGAGTARSVYEVLKAASEREDQRPDLERWASDLLGEQRPSRTTAAERQVRAYLGLDPLPGQGQDEAASPAYHEAAEVAHAFGVSRQRIYQGLSNFRKRWLAAACCDELLSAVTRLVDEASGVLLAHWAGVRLARTHGSGDDPPSDDERRIATALVRIVVELRLVLGEQAPVLLGRVHGRPWLAREAEQIDGLRAIAAAADRLASADELRSTSEVRARIERAAAGTPLAELPSTELVRLAAAAAESAALSARLEIYPPGLSAERVLRLSQSVLAVPQLKEADLRRRIHERYPRAASLPERPELDKLLLPYQLHFHEGYYRRPGVDLPSLSATVSRATRYTSAGPGESRPDTPEAHAAQQLEDTLRSGLERGRFRVISVPADHAIQAAKRLAETFGLVVTSLDHALWRKMQDLMARKRVDPQAVIDADRAGPEGPSWGLLGQVVSAAAEELVDDILAAREHPQLLINPGLLARFSLSAALHRLAEQAEHGDGAAIALLVPTHAKEEGAAPAINETLPVPAPIPGQRLRLTGYWIKNLHRAAVKDQQQ